MSNDNVVTHEHLATIEKYMAQQAASMDNLAKSLNELVIRDKERDIRDEHIHKDIREIQDKLKEHENGMNLSSWFYRMFDNYVMKIAFPFAMTAIIIILIANNVDISAFKGK